MKTADEIIKSGNPINLNSYQTVYSKSDVKKMINTALSQSSDLEKQVEELLAVTGCKNVREVIEYFEHEEIEYSQNIKSKK